MWLKNETTKLLSSFYITAAGKLHEMYEENGKLSLLLRHDDILREIMKGDYCVSVCVGHKDKQRTKDKKDDMRL